MKQRAYGRDRRRYQRQNGKQRAYGRDSRRRRRRINKKLQESKKLQATSVFRICYC